MPSTLKTKTRHSASLLLLAFTCWIGGFCAISWAANQDSAKAGQSEVIIISVAEKQGEKLSLLAITPAGRAIQSIQGTTGGSCYAPKISPDGRQVAFGVDNNGESELWVWSRSSDRIFRGKGVALMGWYDNQTLLYKKQVGTGQTEARILSIDGKNDRLLIGTPFMGQREFSNIALSPDRALLAGTWQKGAWAYSLDVYLVNRDGTNGRIFYKDEGKEYADSSVVWSTNGKTLFWRHEPGRDGKTQIYRQQLNDNKPSILRQQTELLDLYCCSPDGSALLLQLYDPSKRLARMDLGSGQETVLFKAGSFGGADWGMLDSSLVSQLPAPRSGGTPQKTASNWRKYSVRDGDPRQDKKVQQSWAECRKDLKQANITPLSRSSQKADIGTLENEVSDADLYKAMSQTLAIIAEEPGLDGLAWTRVSDSVYLRLRTAAMREILKRSYDIQQGGIYTLRDSLIQEFSRELGVMRDKVNAQPAGSKARDVSQAQQERLQKYFVAVVKSWPVGDGSDETGLPNFSEAATDGMDQLFEIWDAFKDDNDPPSAKDIRGILDWQDKKYKMLEQAYDNEVANLAKSDMLAEKLDEQKKKAVAELAAGGK